MSRSGDAYIDYLNGRGVAPTDFGSYREYQQAFFERFRGVEPYSSALDDIHLAENVGFEIRVIGLERGIRYQRVVRLRTVRLQSVLGLLSVLSFQ